MLKTLICLSFLFLSDIVESKPDYLFRPEVNGWLKLHKVSVTWQEAFHTCHDEGAVLASPINEQLAAALAEMMEESNLDSPIYLGVHAMFSSRDFISIEGVPLADLSVTWGTYGKGRKANDFLTLSTDEKTYMSPGTASLPYICYKKVDNSTILNQCGTFDDDYHFYPATGSCYKYHKKRNTWFRASEICAAEGAHLVIVNNEQEANIVTDFLEKPKKTNSLEDAAHIGLRDWNKDHTWLTIHGEKIENVYNKWAESQPDNRGINLCGCIYPKGTLDDIYCLRPQAFICEKDPNTSRFEKIPSGNSSFE